MSYSNWVTKTFCTANQLFRDTDVSAKLELTAALLSMIIALSPVRDETKMSPA